MSIADVRNAFVAAGNGQLTCTAARLRYVEGNSQIVEFDGFKNGSPFSVVSNPFGANEKPQTMASTMAADLIKS